MQDPASKDPWVSVSTASVPLKERNLKADDLDSKAFTNGDWVTDETMLKLRLMGVQLNKMEPADRDEVSQI